MCPPNGRHVGQYTDVGEMADFFKVSVVANMQP